MATSPIFVERIIELQFTNIDGQNFAGSTSPMLTVSGLRTSIKISNVVAPGSGTLQGEVRGLSLAVMNQISTLGMVLQKVKKTNIAVRAGDTVNGLATIFQGNIIMAFPDLAGAPEAVLKFSATSTAFNSVLQIQDTSYNGNVSTQTLFGNLAQQMGVVLEMDQSISFPVANPHLRGSPMNQVWSAADAYGYNATVHNGKLIVVLKTTARKGGTPIVISRDTGMIGYPAFGPAYIIVSVLFNPGIEFLNSVTIESILVPPLNAMCVVGAMDIDLQSADPDGRWQETLQCYTPGHPPPLPQ